MLTLRNATVAVVALAIVLTIAAGPASAADRIADLPTTVERWGVYEVRLTGPADGLRKFESATVALERRQLVTELRAVG